MRFLNTFGIIRIVFNIYFSFVREINLIIVWSYASKHFLNKESCMLLYYNTNTSLANHNRIFFSGLNLLKEDCLHHIEHEPVLLTDKEFNFCIIGHQIHQLLHMKGCSFYVHVWIMGMYPIKRWFYQNDLDTTTLKKIPCSLKILPLKNRGVRFKYRNSSVIHIHEIQQQNSLEI